MAINLGVDVSTLRFCRFINPKAILIWLRSLLEAWLIDESQFLKAGTAFSRVDRFQQVKQSETFTGHPVPKLLGATAPKVPGITALDFVGRQLDAAVHGLEDVKRNFWKVFKLAPTAIIEQRVHFLSAAGAGEGHEGEKHEPGENCIFYFHSGLLG